MHRAISEGSRRPFAAIDLARVAWLPRDGVGNGLDSNMWAPILRAVPALARCLLARLADAGVPAYAAPIRGHGQPVWQIWIGTLRYATGEDVLRSALPDLLNEHPDGVE